ncbi:MAG: hypothetical protein AAF601_13415 [Pseudomonadota bacterium]
MKGGLPTSVFVERRSYRRRRLMDALRLLPILGVMLFMLPLFWPTTADEAVATVPMSRAVTYVFLVWAVLIVVALALWRALWLTGGPVGDDEAAQEDRL